jgi:hypothetical protein
MIIGEWPPLPDELIAELRARPRPRPEPPCGVTEQWVMNFYRHMWFDVESG